MASSDETAVAALSEWNSALEPHRIDIVCDFAGKELFAILGESLVSHCIEEAKVDYSHGFQLLHAVHAVETFLARFKQRGANFHILWFDSHEQLAIPRDASPENHHKYLLTRAVLIEHLRHVKADDIAKLDAAAESSSTMSGPISFKFPAIRSDEFSEYAKQFPLHFILSARGVLPKTVPDVQSEEWNQLVVMRILADLGYNLGFIDDVEFCSSKVYTRLVMSSQVSEAIEVPEPKAPEQRNEEYAKLSTQLLEKFPLFDDRQTATETDVREHVGIVACAALLTQKPGAGTEKRVAAFLVHLAMIEHGDLYQRSIDEADVSELSQEDQQFLEEYSTAARILIRNRVYGNASQDVILRVCDIVDGRLFHHVLQNLDKMQLVSDMGTKVEALKILVGTDIQTHFPPRAQSNGTNGQQHTNGRPVTKTSAVLAFSNPIFDPYLQGMNLETMKDPKNSAAGSTIFRELTHWHSAKKPLDPKAPPKPLDKWAQRRQQRFMADTIAYSASLTSASGKNITPETIISRPPQKEGRDKGKTKETKAPAQDWKAELQQRQAPKSAKGGPKGGKGQPSGKAKALEEAKKVQTMKEETKSKAIVSYFAQQVDNLEAINSLVKRYLAANRYYLNLSPADRETIGAELTLYVCKTLAQHLGEPPFSDTDISTIALLRSHVLETYKLPPTTQTQKQLAYLISALQLPAPSQTTNVIDRALPFKPSMQKTAKILPSTATGREFQLEHCGPYMERSFDSAPDPRVPFNPDAWQRKVLDAIDKDNSLFVVAPTSAGKTFISFYAMKKILQSNDDDVLVYVAPTKALVNQIAAEVQARFSKAYGRPGKSVWAIHTRDYRINNPQGCQVLVTVPHVLQIMLLSASNAQKPDSWARRVKRIIFDEVHCIGQAEDGVVWEQLLLLAPCPIIALSATVGNPIQFHDWLAAAQKAKGFELEMVVHTQRHNDLRKFAYRPPKELDFKGFEPVERLPIPGLDANDIDSDRFAFMHPMGSIANKTKETVNDIALEPRDCLKLWQVASKRASETFAISNQLSPATALPEIIKKADIADWEAGLKGQLQDWMVVPDSPFNDVYQDLQSDLGPSVQFTEADQSTFSLLVDLRKRGAMPAIVFHYDRDGCEAILMSLLDTLKTAENEYRETSKEWESKMNSYNKWKEAYDAKNKVKAALAASKAKSKDDGAGSKAEQMRDEADKETSPWASFNPDHPIEQFSFGDSTKITTSEFEDLIWSLSSWAKVPPPFVEALRRGLGVHHAGMNRQYRQVVEMLFRKGFLSAVIATGTLALGLNMPCKTVVFAGDSVFLTTLNYRQASGRAGRRGFDLLGNVVFHGIPQHRVSEIMSARLPDLKGTFPMTVSLILRLFGLLHGTNGSEYAIKAIESLLTQTRLYLGGPSSQMSIKHHLRFSIEYLRRQSLLSSNGTPQNFAGLVGHLYFTENAAFSFHALLKEGYLHELCADFENPAKQKDILQTLTLVMSHLFCRLPCKRYKDEDWLRDVVHRSPSLVLLPRLPEDAEKIISAHNKETLDIFRTYVGTYIDQHLKDSSDDVLPFTGRQAGPKEAEKVDLSASNLPVRPGTSIRSAFAALSGFTDDFSTVHELCESARSDVFLEEESIPHTAMYPDETNGVPWNAYILDFFKHGDLDCLVRDNGIKRGDVWFHLKDFSMVLATITTSIASILNANSEEGDDAAMIDIQDVGDALEEALGAERDDIPAIGATNGEAAATANATKADVAKPKKKKVEADTWDAESDEEWDAGSSSDESEEDEAPADWSPDSKSLVSILKAFVALQTEFNEKFRKVWA